VRWRLLLVVVGEAVLLNTQVTSIIIKGYPSNKRDNISILRFCSYRNGPRADNIPAHILGSNADQHWQRTIHTVTAAIEGGYRVLVPVDACGGMTARTEAAALRQIEAFGGETTTVVHLRKLFCHLRAFSGSGMLIWVFNTPADFYRTRS
jgi:Isochorismatase family